MDLESALTEVPVNVSTRLVAAYAAAVDSYSQARDWAATSTHAGQVMELAIRALDPTHVTNSRGVQVDKWCKDVEDNKRTGPGISIPMARAIRALYALRNKRGAAHDSEDVPANHMDASLALAISRWVLAELVRSQAGLPVDDALRIVEQLADGDAGVAFARILGHRFSRYGACAPLQRPSYLADRDSLGALKAQPGLDLLDDAKLGYLYASAVHQDLGIDAWRKVAPKTVAGAAPMAWLATFEDYASARRAKQELDRLPSNVREEAERLAAAELRAVDHPTPATDDDARVLLQQLMALRTTMQERLREDRLVQDRLDASETRDLVDRLKSLLSLPQLAVAGSRPQRGGNLDEAAAGFVFALCVYLKHRDTDLWRLVDQGSEASARWLADIVARPVRGARFRAAPNSPSIRGNDAERPLPMPAAAATSRPGRSPTRCGRDGTQC